jgi:putative phosphoribosyl transferase
MPGTVFADRSDAGRQLGERLDELGLAEPGGLVAGIPRGGIVVAAHVARATSLPLRAVLARKVGAPGHRELAIGAVGPDGSALLDDELLDRIGIGPEWAERAVGEQRAAISQLAARFPCVLTAPAVEGRSVIVVDDGVATGATAAAVGGWLRLAGAGRCILALPVGPPNTLDRLAEAYDEVVVLARPRAFLAVGQWYDDFTQTTDDEVVDLLEELCGEIE